MRGIQARVLEAGGAPVLRYGCSRFGGSERACCYSSSARVREAITWGRFCYPFVPSFECFTPVIHTDIINSVRFFPAAAEQIMINRHVFVPDNSAVADVDRIGILSYAFSYDLRVWELIAR